MIHWGIIPPLNSLNYCINNCWHDSSNYWFAKSTFDHFLWNWSSPFTLTYVCVVGSCALLVNTTSSQEDQFESCIMWIVALSSFGGIFCPLPVGRFCPLQTHLLPSSLACISCPLHWHISPALFSGTHSLPSSLAYISWYWIYVPSVTENLTVIGYLFSSYGGCRCIQLIMHYYGNHSHNTG